MTIALTVLKPAASSTIALTRPPIEFTVTSDQPDTSVKFEFWISQSATPVTDSAAIYGILTDTLVYTGFSASYYRALTMPANVTLTPGTWYVSGRVSLTSDSSVIALLTQQFTVLFTPAALQLTPTIGQSSRFVNTANNAMFTWSFTGSTENADYQTAYQVVVTKVSDGTTVVDTGKVSSSVSQSVVSIPVAQTDVSLAWKVRVWNKWDSPSAYTGTRTFILSGAFSLAFTVPTANQVLSVGNPNATVTVTISAGRAVKAITLTAWAAGTLVWSKTVYGNWVTGNSVNITAPESVFTTGVAYQYRATAQDTLGTYSIEASQSFTVSYTSPGIPTGSPTLAVGNYADLGYITVTWNDANRDIDYYCWQVERRDDLINVDTQAVITTGTWNSVGRVYGTAATYNFKDYMAPSNYRVTYRVKQIAVRYGTEVQSTPMADSTSVFPVTEHYWLFAGINGDVAAVALALYNVTGESFTDETESAEMVLIGRGRYVEKGSRLGVKGSLDMKLRYTGGLTAREKRFALQSFKTTYPTAKLRNPFGDYYQVSLSDISVGRVAGTGKSEFCDVTVPYVEVVQ